MAKFTEIEASGCTIQKCSHSTINGVHKYYIFGVTDDNDFYYEWVDKALVSGATETQVKTAIKDHLTTSVDKVVPAPVIVETDDTDIIGDIVG